MTTATNRIQADVRGRIDIHSHLLTGIDDGCINFDESLESIQRLMTFGYVGSICTPHVTPETFPQNTPTHIESWTAQLADQLRCAGVAYRVWSGGELGLFEGAVDWMKQHGVPTMGGSKCVLTDFWLERWPAWVTGTFEWFLANGYQPILAHPERLPLTEHLEKNLARLTDMGVWLQGNFRSFTGEDGWHIDLLVRKLMDEGRFHFLALDMHRPDSLEVRLDGLRLVAEQYGSEALDELTIDAPHRYILGAAGSTRAAV